MNDFQRGRFYLITLNKRTGMHTIHSGQSESHSDCVARAQSMSQTAAHCHRLIFKVHHQDGKISRH
jgi:hypothetical protein